MKVRELTTCLLDKLLLVDRLYVENSGKRSDITGLVTITVGTTRGANGTTEIVVGIKRIMRITHLVAETAEIEKKP